jgi:hypothetical protein
MKGIIQSAPVHIDKRRISFAVVLDDTNEQISCQSSLEFDAAELKLKSGDKVILDGDWIRDAKDQPVTFKFNTLRKVV